MDEKRAAVRWRVALPVRYAGLNTPTEGACHTCDVSTSGARLAMVERHNAGDRLDMMLDMPDSDAGHLCLEGDVVWQREVCEFNEECKYLTGIVFRKILNCHRKDLAQYVSTNYPQEFRSRWWEGIQ